VILGANQCLENLICRFHRHSTEIGHKVSALSMARKTALGAALGVLASKGKEVTAVAAPVRGDVGESFETVRNAVVDLLFVGIGLVVGLADTFGDNLGVTPFVTGILAVRTLHACGVLEEFPT
jgi:hypothetical protein